MGDVGTEENAPLSTAWPSVSALQAGPDQNAIRVRSRLYLITQLTQEVKGAKWSCSSAADISGCLRLFMAPSSCHQGKQQSV